MRHGQFSVAVEPQVDLSTGKILAFECLTRWMHPRDGVVLPGKFIPQLERHGLIGQLTLVIIERALAIRGRLRQRGLDVGISVNISSKSLLDWNFPTDLMRLSKAAGDSLQGLTLEVTESSELADDSLSGECIRALSALELRLSLDDFWTGYSSLSKPNLDAFDEVKIDYQLTRRIQDDKIALAGISSIQTFSRMLGWRCVVEGIESPESVSLLLALGCSVGQGYLFSHPIDENQLDEWLDANALNGYLEVPFQSNAGTVHTLPVADDNRLLVHTRSTIPIWLFNVDRMTMHWANQAALRLWMADDLEEFRRRDFSSDMSGAVYRRLLDLREILGCGNTIAEQWTVYPRDTPKQVYSVMRGSTSLEGHFLLEVHGYEGIGPMADALNVPSTNALPIPSFAIHDDGRIYWQNTAAKRAFSSWGSNFYSGCSPREKCEKFIAEVLRDGAGTIDIRMRTNRCSMPCRIEGSRVRDPASGKRGVLLTVTQMCDVYGCSHEGLDPVGAVA